MSTDLSKPDTEVTVSLDTILDMDEGEDNILGQANISDLLDTDVGADISGHQSESQSAYEKGTWEQPHPVTNSKSPPQDQEASSCMAQQGCQPVAELATLMQQVLSRLTALEVENQGLKSDVQTLSSQVEALGLELRPRSDTAKEQSDLCVKRVNEGVKYTTKLTEVQRKNWVSYYDTELKPPLSFREACEFIRACGWPAERLQHASTATVNDVACGIARLYFCQNLSEGIDMRHHYISWNNVTMTECVDYISWATPCLREWLDWV